MRFLWPVLSLPLLVTSLVLPPAQAVMPITELDEIHFNVRSKPLTVSLEEIRTEAFFLRSATQRIRASIEPEELHRRWQEEYRQWIAQREVLDRESGKPYYAFVDRIMKRLTRNRPDLRSYEIKILRSSQINGSSTGPVIFLTTGGLDVLMKISEEHAALMIAHEIGHSELKHVEFNIALNQLDPPGRVVRSREDLIRYLAVKYVNRLHEMDADLFARKLTASAGMLPDDPLNWNHGRTQDSGSILDENWLRSELLSTHPTISRRKRFFR